MIDLKHLKLFAKFWFEAGWEEKELGYDNPTDRFEFLFFDSETYKRLIEFRKYWEQFQNKTEDIHLSTHSEIDEKYKKLEDFVNVYIESLTKRIRNLELENIKRNTCIAELEEKLKEEIESCINYFKEEIESCYDCNKNPKKFNERINKLEEDLLEIDRGFTQECEYTEILESRIGILEKKKLELLDDMNERIGKNSEGCRKDLIRLNQLEIKIGELHDN